ncbi:(2Fe-2S)-binding protein [bacterium]|nr:(2Fe-2S)-binding protein [bacterium]
MSKVRLIIDGTEIEVDEGTNLIEAAKQIGLEIPHFCYHPGLSPDGNCRMCLVEVEKIPKPVIACKTVATEGMVVKTNTELIEKARSSVMEFLLINHPLDCPTCDQAGECKLQDYYMDYDLQPSRYKEKKVRKRKMIDLGSGVMLDEERCVVCRRCVRFCREIAGKEELYVQERGHNSMVATFPGKEMTNPYSGNTVDVCPVGALTSKDFRYKKRVWYLSQTDSICPGCSRGCNISIHYEGNVVYRLKPRENLEVNKYWMCDFGRYDYKFINEERRLIPAYRKDGVFSEVSYQEAMSYLRETLTSYDPLNIAFIASAQESVEAIDSFVAFAKDKFFADTVYYSKNDPAQSYADDILIAKDKNPNLAHIQKLGLKEVEAIAKDIQAVVIQRNLSESDLGLIKKRGLKVLVLFATNYTKVDERALVIFPIPTYAEQSGCYVNCDGMMQSFKKAFDAQGEAKTIQEYIAEIGALL